MLIWAWWEGEVVVLRRWEGKRQRRKRDRVRRSRKIAFLVNVFLVRREKGWWWW